MKKIFLLIILSVILSGCSANKSKEVANNESTGEKANALISGVRGPDDLNRKVPNIPLDTIATNLGTLSSICTRENDIIVSDYDNHKLIVLDFNGNILNEVGTMGAEPLQFKNPKDLFWDEKEEILYVLDSGNFRIQKISYDLSYLDEVSLKELEDLNSDSFKSMVVDSMGNIYLSLPGNSLSQSKIYSISPDGTIDSKETFFRDILAEKDGEIYAMESIVFTTSSDGLSTTGTGGQTALYKVNGLDLVKELDFPYLYTPSDILWAKDKVFIASSLWNLLESFKIENNKLIYLETISPDIPKTGKYDHFPFTLAYFEDTIFLACFGSGNIYKFKI